MMKPGPAPTLETGQKTGLEKAENKFRSTDFGAVARDLPRDMVCGGPVSGRFEPSKYT
jgi:hypothetical protein